MRGVAGFVMGVVGWVGWDGDACRQVLSSPALLRRGSTSNAQTSFFCEPCKNVVCILVPAVIVTEIVTESQSLENACRAL